MFTRIINKKVDEIMKYLVKLTILFFLLRFKINKWLAHIISGSTDTIHCNYNEKFLSIGHLMIKMQLVHRDLNFDIWGTIGDNKHSDIKNRQIENNDEFDKH